jgi:hypothetical protein
MIKATQSEARTAAIADSDQKQLVCWNKDAQAQCLRVELSDDRSFIFPYTHLTFASMERDEGRDVLTASFTTHDLRIVGKNLRELGIALQRLAVDWIKPAPARYAALASSEAVYIESIAVNEADEQGTE